MIENVLIKFILHTVIGFTFSFLLTMTLRELILYSYDNIKFYFQKYLFTFIGKKKLIKKLSKNYKFMNYNDTIFRRIFKIKK